MTDQSTNPSIMESKPLHPLHQIASTPTHKLLLKQWLKEETQIDSVRKEITMLYIFFFLFHSTALILLFNASARDPHGVACHRSWIPSLCSLLFSLGLIWAIRYKTDMEVHLEKLLEREKEDGKLMAKCVEELKKKGVEFDLMKEVDALRRAKSVRFYVQRGRGEEDPNEISVQQMETESTFFIDVRLLKQPKLQPLTTT